MKPAIFSIMLLFTLPRCLMAQAHVPDSVQISKNEKVSAVQYGTASFYHNKFEGRKTATGEIFSQKKISAASNRFPLNCWVKVTNLKNKRSIILRVNDRMHHLNKRLIDLSRSAAAELNYTGRGLTKVKVEYLGRKRPAEDTLAQGNK